MPHTDDVSICILLFVHNSDDSLLCTAKTNSIFQLDFFIYLFLFNQTKFK